MNNLLHRLEKTRATSLATLQNADLEAVIYADEGWRVKDILTHLTAWEEEAAKSLQAYCEGRSYRVKTSSAEAYSEAIFQARRDYPSQQVFAEWAVARANVQTLIKTLPEEKRDGTLISPWGVPNTLFALVEEMISYEKLHLAQILKILQPGSIEGSLKGFYHWYFTVPSDVSTPIPTTEHLVDAAYQWAKTHYPDGEGLVVADIGTGCGVIGISLALLLPKTQIFSTEVSHQVLNIARQNAARLGADTIQSEGDLLLALAEETQVNLIISNLPFAPTAELPKFNTDQEGLYLALDGGYDGLELFRRLLEQAPRYLKTGGALFLQVGNEEQGKYVQQFANTIFPAAQIEVQFNEANLTSHVVVKV